MTQLEPQRMLRLVCALAFCAGASRPAEVCAQAAPRAAEIALIREGRDMLVTGHPEEALARFRLAFELGRSPTALAHMGVAQGALGHFVDAEDCLRRALVSAPDALMERAWLPRFQENLRIAQRQVGVLAIEASVAGAVITANGQRVGLTPLREPIRLPVGRVRLTASLEGRPTIEREIQLMGGDTIVRERFEFAEAARRAVAPTVAPGPTTASRSNVLPRRARAESSRTTPAAPWTALAVSSGVATVVGITAGVSGLAVAQHNATQYSEGECGMSDDVPECGRALTLGQAAAATSFAGWALGAIGAIGTGLFTRSARASHREAGARAWVIPIRGGAAISGEF